MVVSPLALLPGWHFGGLYPLLLAAVGTCLVVGALVLKRPHRRPVPPSVLYVLLGALGAVCLALLDVNPLGPESDHELLERLCELALVVAVFSAGLTIERHVERRSLASIAILLIVVMPLTILAIAAFGVWAMGLSFGAALVLGAVLAPTDPVLAGNVGLTAPGGEVLGEPRLSLHTEAGFNDGLASPFVVLGLFAVTDGGTAWLSTWALADLLYGAGFALALGALSGYLTARALTMAERMLSDALQPFAVVGFALVLYGVTEVLGAYGLLAVFAAGFTFRRYEFDHHVHHAAHRGTEATGKTLELVVLVMLGSMLTTDGLGAPGLAGWLLVPVLLVLIRPGLVVATLGRWPLDLRGAIFLGFFGVRGVAALFYAAVVVDSGALSTREQHVVVWTTIVCVVSSIIVHGLTAAPLTRRLAQRDAGAND
ncbi:MAG: cation:proton antiporter [Solirubrobacteraceae bacterium]